MFTVTPVQVLPYVFVAWLGLSIASYAGIRLYLRRRGEPTGWRFNHHGAHWFPGHLSFYPREGNEQKGGVLLRSVTLFPIYWKVQKGPSRSDLETVRRGPVWSVIPWAFNYMGNLAIVSTSENLDG